MGKAVQRRQGKGLAILAFGTLLTAALEAGETLDATVVDMRFVKPLDEALLAELAATREAFVTVEEGAIMGGAGSAVQGCFAASGLAVPRLQLGLAGRAIDPRRPATRLNEPGPDGSG